MGTSPWATVGLSDRYRERCNWIAGHARRAVPDVPASGPELVRSGGELFLYKVERRDGDWDQPNWAF